MNKASDICGHCGRRYDDGIHTYHTINHAHQFLPKPKESDDEQQQ